MSPTERVRQCHECNRVVRDVSTMTEPTAMSRFKKRERARVRYLCDAFEQLVFQKEASILLMIAHDASTQLRRNHCRCRNGSSFRDGPTQSPSFIAFVDA